MSPLENEALFRRLALGSPETWVAVAYLVGMFLLGIFRPRQIGSRASYRLSCILFLLYFILPAVAELILVLAQPSTSSRGASSFTRTALTIRLALVHVSHILLGLSITLGLGSIRIRPENDPSSRERSRSEVGVPVLNKCPRCEAYLSANELSDGWCDSCGKKLPNRSPVEGA